MDAKVTKSGQFRYGCYTNNRPNSYEVLNSHGCSYLFFVLVSSRGDCVNVQDKGGLRAQLNPPWNFPADSLCINYTQPWAEVLTLRIFIVIDVNISCGMFGG